MAQSTKVSDTCTPDQRILPGPTRDATAFTASDNVSCRSADSDLNDQSRPKSDGTQTRFDHRDPPWRMDSPRLTELEEGHAQPNERHQLTNLSSTALHLRIAALEQNQVTLLERIAALESLIPHINSGSAGQKAPVTLSPWRVLNSVLVLGAGAYKAVATLQGQTAGPTAVDWIVGVLWSLTAYWVSFLDNSTNGHSNWFFDHDLSAVVFIVLEDLVALGLCAGIVAIALTTMLKYETAGIVFFVVVWCAATSGVGLLVLLPMVRRWISSTWRSLRSTMAIPHFPPGLFIPSDWSVRNPPGLFIIVIFLLICAPLHCK
ncbi:hypothetical protein MVEN_01166400 [Mycena venus]|uniref:Transmembrane protein n=1 Tax=Mycena venus TaxID=2733690 RepID=A0A8H6Y5H6_9AGAR|nr:hypothetical protein MVEN_01166400 [Mycena venus]